jgi:NTP-dependent ternary system trypsin peptidase co-occuring protein
MPEYRVFQGSSGSVTLEVALSEGSGAGGGNLREGISGPMQSVVAAFCDEMARMPKEKKPSELEVSFGMRALNNGGFAVVLDPVQASFHVKMKWSGSEAGAAEEFLPTGR